MIALTYKVTGKPTPNARAEKNIFKWDFEWMNQGGNWKWGDAFILFSDQINTSAQEVFKASYAIS